MTCISTRLMLMKAEVVCWMQGAMGIKHSVHKNLFKKGVDRNEHSIVCFCG